MKIYENLNINDLNGEIWKVVEEYPEYQVSNFGRVKSFIKWNGTNKRIMKQQKRGKYFQVDLWKNGKRKIKKVHRLVFENFIEKLEEGYDAHHINGDEKDNFVENLESKEHREHTIDHHKGTHYSEETKKKISETRKEKFKNGELNFKGEKHPLFGRHHSEKTRKLMSKSKKGENHPNFGKGIPNQKIIDIHTDIEKKIYTQREIAKKHKVCQNTISRIKTGKIKIL
jgi:hypothetical protein